MGINDYIGNYCIISNDVKTVDELKLLNTDQMVYEVVRVVDGVPLFLEEHFFRLEKSATLLGVKLSYRLNSIKENIIKLISLEQVVNCNVKIIISFIENSQTIAIYTSKFYYPTNEEYSKGVIVSLLNLERENPNVKKLNNQYTKTISEKVFETKAFELLLVNSNNQILEGSKSNAFFIQEKKVLTAPSNLVLEGITRRLVIEICNKLGIELAQTILTVNDLSKIDGIFLTGTSIKVLPVSKIDNCDFCPSSNNIVATIQKEYDEFMKQYILKNCIMILLLIYG
jgi:branched-chain amino acid aminotransferase